MKDGVSSAFRTAVDNLLAVYQEDLMATKFCECPANLVENQLPARSAARSGKTDGIPMVSPDEPVAFSDTSSHKAPEEPEELERFDDPDGEMLTGCGTIQSRPRYNRVSESAQQAVQVFLEEEQRKVSRKKQLVSNLVGADIQNADWYASLSALFRSPLFDALTAFVILFSALIIGLETQWQSEHMHGSSTYDAMSLACDIFFVFELLCRAWAHGREIFGHTLRHWFVFDSILVMQFLIPSILGPLQQSSVSEFTGLKTIKMLRVVRVFRVFRFFRVLTEMASMIIDSIRFLMFALIILALVLFVFSVVISTQVTEWLSSEVDVSDHDWQNQITQHSHAHIKETYAAYGTLTRTFYTLWQTVQGGVSWHEVCDPLFHNGVFLPVLVMTYIAFTTLAMLNIITGIFVDNAFHFAQSQRNIAILKEIDKKKEYEQKIRDFFRSIDEDGSGEVDVAEFAEVLEDPTLSAYFRVLEFDVDDAQRFIDLLDLDNSNTLTIDEFLMGCERYKGPAQGVDVHACLKECKEIHKMLNGLGKHFGQDLYTLVRP